MTTLEVYDPPMCCSTGVCGPQVDPALVHFAADLDWLKGQGVAVERFNLGQQPGAFARSEAVTGALTEKGNDCLPLILVDGRIMSQGAYPSRAELAGFAGLRDRVPVVLFTPAVGELVALGAAIASNCVPCFRYHYDKARKLGVSDEDMTRAVETGLAVKNASGQEVLALAERYLVHDTADQSEAVPQSSSCCGPSAAPGSGSKCC